jgi:hypothetical protein
MSKKPDERCSDKLGEIRLVARAEGYVMVRRRGCIPFVVSEKEWQKMLGTPVETPKVSP